MDFVQHAQRSSGVVVQQKMKRYRKEKKLPDRKKYIFRSNAPIPSFYSGKLDYGAGCGGCVQPCDLSDRIALAHRYPFISPRKSL